MGKQKATTTVYFLKLTQIFLQIVNGASAHCYCFDTTTTVNNPFKWQKQWIKTKNLKPFTQCKALSLDNISTKHQQNLMPIKQESDKSVCLPKA